MTGERIIFMGTPDFAVPCLRALVDSRDEVVAVVTNPDRPAGRGKAPTPPPVKRAALELGAPVHQPTSVRSSEFLEWFADQRPDRAIVVAYGRILPQAVLDIPRYGCINVHASVLPELRGAAPINWAIVRGARETGVSIMQMEAGLDSGPVYSVETLKIHPDETAGELHDRLMVLGARVLRGTLDRIQDGTLSYVPQDDARSTYAPMMAKSDGDIDWSLSASEIVRRIHGFNPWPGAWTTLRTPSATKLDGQRLKLHRARALDGEGQAGVCAVEGSQLIVGCGSGRVEVLSLQAPGKRTMPAADFVRGVDAHGALLQHTSFT